MKHLEIWITAAAVLLSLVLFLSTGNQSAVETGSWGLHFYTEGQPPAAPADDGALSKLGAAYRKNTEEKILYLTFDAGYENGCTAQILDALQAHQVPAVFFLVGNYLEQNPDLVRRMVNEGHTVANHTLNHPDMSKITDKTAFSRELTGLEDLYREITGQELAKFYRPPQGLYSEENLEMAQSMGYKTVFWSLAYADWDNNNQPSREAALEKLLSRVHPGAVVLLHSTSKTNAAILDELLTKWEEMGYTFRPITDLFA